MLEGKPMELQARLSTEITVRASADQIENPLRIQGRVGIAAQVTVHQAESTTPRQEAMHNGPGHRGRRGQDFGQVVAAPDGAAGFGPRLERGDLFLAHLRTLTGSAGRNRASLQQPELATR